MSIILDPGDVVKLRDGFGRLLPAGTVGLVTVVYDALPAFTTMGGALAAPDPRYGVHFPSLKKTSPPQQGSWLPNGLHFLGAFLYHHTTDSTI